MLQEKEAQELIITLISLREKVEEFKSKQNISELKEHENLCIKKFRYLVTMRTNKYKKFNNYEDLNQEGMEALLKSMKNYNPKKGNFFYWAHRYIDTRISRSANLHTTIRYPLKIAKENIPHKESIMPILIEEIHCPDKELEKIQAINIIKSSLPLLSDEQNNVISLAYGINMDKPYSINKICKELHISRSSCVKLIHSAISVIKHNVII